MDLAGLTRDNTELEDVSGPNGLYDLDVQILPTEQSSIIRILQEQPFPLKRLNLGSSTFLLIKVGVYVAEDTQKERREYARQEIDDLIEALEEELGDSTMSYMTVRLSHRLPAPSEWQDVGNTNNEMFSMQSKVETVATASVKLHNTRSLWSPAPVLKSNPLLPLIERHWGITNAREVLRRIAAPGSEAPGSQTPLGDSHTPVIPLRTASLQRHRGKVEPDHITTLSRARSQ
ncbi:hypothetical protein FLONG3_2435 [Fusarium longipes]|uniref:Uncharacterized protein n=1 Tax=Fusarium longipes TaxID=694270 RepID=A0A395T414_9HYPO|nr:hypothetical protein FLONG3_2435 [Fusarium longipes]